MIIFIYGEDTFRSRRYLQEQVNKFKQTRDPQGYNVVFLDGKKENAGKILEEIAAAPFLAQRRMIIVENLLSSNKKEIFEEITQGINHKKFPEDNVLIFYQEEPLGKTKEAKELHSLLIKEKYVQKFDCLKPEQLKKWLHIELTARGGVFEEGVIEYIVAYLDNDLWFLNSLLDQLYAFKKESMISLQDVELFSSQITKTDMFELVEAILNKNGKKAFDLLGEQRRKGFEEQELFGLLIWNMRILLELRDAYERNDKVSSELLAKEMKIHPFVVKKNFVLMKKYSLAFLKQLYGQLLQIDNKTKTGFSNQSLLIDMFAVKI